MWGKTEALYYLTFGIYLGTSWGTGYLQKPQYLSVKQNRLARFYRVLGNRLSTSEHKWGIKLFNKSFHLRQSVLLSDRNQMRVLRASLSRTTLNYRTVPRPHTHSLKDTHRNSSSAPFSLSLWTKEWPVASRTMPPSALFFSTLLFHLFLSLFHSMVAVIG